MSKFRFFGLKIWHFLLFCLPFVSYDIELHLTTIVIESTAFEWIPSLWTAPSCHIVIIEPLLLNPRTCCDLSIITKQSLLLRLHPLPSHADSTILLHPNCYNVTIHKCVQNQGAFFFETNLQDMSATEDIISWNVVNIFKTFSEAVT